MSNENDQNQNDKNFEHLSPEQAEKARKAVAKLEIVKAVKQISNPNSPWNLTQEIMQEIVATHTIANPDAKLPAIVKLIEELKTEINIRYQGEEELKKLLLESVPSQNAVRAWFAKEGWKDAVWSKLRVSGLFTESKRAEMIEALRHRGLQKDTTAAKIWLTLSGDYQEKMDINSDKTVETFREINKILLSKKNASE